MGFQSQREMVTDPGSLSYLVSEVNEGLPAPKACTFFSPLGNWDIQRLFNQLHQHLGGERTNAVSFFRSKLWGYFKLS